jgi:isoleucyl-tRNA synthetase
MLEICKNEYYNSGEAPERSVDVEIAIRLKENKAFKVEKYVHSYPLLENGQPYYPLDSWFIKNH